MQDSTVGIVARLRKTGDKDVVLQLRSRYSGCLSPYALIENGAYRGDRAGHVASLEQELDLIVSNEYSGYEVQSRVVIAMRGEAP